MIMETADFIIPDTEGDDMHTLQINGENNITTVIHPPLSNAGTLKVLIMSHGFRGSKDGGGRAIMLADHAAHIGFTVIRYDFTPQQNLSLQVSELRTVVEYTRRKLGNSIYLLGRSMGGSASLAYAAQDSTIKGLCLWSTPWNLHETFRLALGEGYRHLLAGVPFAADDAYGHVELSPEFVRDFANFDLLQSIRETGSMPLLVLHGTADAIVPLPQARKLYHEAGEPKQLTLIEGGDHQFSQHAAEAAAAVINWLKTLD